MVLKTNDAMLEQIRAYFTNQANLKAGWILCLLDDVVTLKAEHNRLESHAGAQSLLAENYREELEARPAEQLMDGMEERITMLETELEVTLMHRGIMGNVLKYIHFVLTKTNETEGDLCNSAQLAADRIGGHVTDLEQQLTFLSQRVKGLEEEAARLCYDLISERRCSTSLRTERDALTAELTIAKQATADALHELRSAVAVIEQIKRECETNYAKPLDVCHAIYSLVLKWLTTHALQMKAPIAAPDPEQEAEQVKEQMLEDR